MTIYSAYNIVDTDISKVGPNTVFHQQWRIQRLNGNLSPNPKLQMIKDLSADIKSLQKDPRDSLCIMGDFNENLGIKPKWMINIYHTHKL